MMKVQKKWRPPKKKTVPNASSMQHPERQRRLLGRRTLGRGEVVGACSMEVVGARCHCSEPDRKPCLAEVVGVAKQAVPKVHFLLCVHPAVVEEALEARLRIRLALFVVASLPAPLHPPFHFELQA